MIENENGRMEVSLTMKNGKTANLSTEEIGDLLSVLLGFPLVSAQNNAFFWETAGRPFIMWRKPDTMC